MHGRPWCRVFPRRFGEEEFALTLQDFSVQGKQAVVIGGGRGIGRGIALTLAEAGADVAVAALTPAKVFDVAGRAAALGVKANAYTVDATDGASMDSLAARVLADFPDISIVVNSVGDSLRQPVTTLPESPDAPGMSSADWRRIVDINLTSVFEGCRIFGPRLIERGEGVVLNVSGIRGLRAMLYGSAYSAGKAGLTKLTESLALEWAAHGIRVNAIAPGLFPDPEQESAEQLLQREAEIRPRVPLGRSGPLRDVGLMAVYLASDAGAYITGQTFVIDGGAVIL